MAHKAYSGPSYTREMAEFAVNLKLSQVPSEVVTRAKGLILDGFGCGLFAANLPWTKILADLVHRLEPQGGHASIWGRGETTSAISAALLNGTMVQGYELDDANAACFHACAVVLPAAFAAAEFLGADTITGEKMLTAIIAGFELGPRVGLCMNGDLMMVKGWHPPGIFGPFAAAVTAGIVLGLTADQMFHALGIAGPQASGLMAAQFGSMVKRMLCGKNAQSGVYAAMLAAGGFTGIENVFEQPYGGYCTTFTQTEDDFDLAQLSDGLGTRWETMRITLKRFCCSAMVMAPLDAVQEIVAETGLKAGDVEAITVAATDTTISHGGWWPYVPGGLTGAQMHIGFGIAMLLIEGDVFVDQMVEANVQRPDLVELANRVKVVRSEAREQLGREYHRGADVQVLLKNGTVIRKTADFFLGTCERPMSDAQMSEKYRKLASKTLPATEIAAIEAAVWGLEREPSVARLAGILRGEKKGLLF
jgi:2-methylcitrate dehydratase PrpD